MISTFDSAADAEPITASVHLDGRGRAHVNIFVEWLWRSVKYEEVHPHDYDSPTQAWQGLDRYFRFSNHQRPHQGLEDYPPAAVEA